ncbi:MAG TPA: AI-2E family transporter, partial [Thermotoga sp.]|nr:AI-2E family transporter [Thermotoga sp.]
LFTVIIHSIAFILFIHLMKGYAKLNPINIIFSILFFGKVFGFLGVFIAVPLAIYVQIIWKRFIDPILERVV